MSMLPTTVRIHSPNATDNPLMSRMEMAKIQGKQKATKQIKLQESRSRIRNNLRKRIKITFSKEGLELDPERRAILHRQYEDNAKAYEFKIDQEKHKQHNNNLRRVNRSFNRLEVQNKNFLHQIHSFRHERAEI